MTKASLSQHRNRQYQAESSNDMYRGEENLSLPFDAIEICDLLMMATSAIREHVYQRAVIAQYPLHGFASDIVTKKIGSLVIADKFVYGAIHLLVFPLSVRALGSETIGLRLRSLCDDFNAVVTS